MKKANDQQGSSLIEVIAALILFSMVAAGLAIAIPMAYGRLTTWREQFNLGRYLEKQLEEVRSNSFTALPVTDTGFIADGDYQYRWVTTYVSDDQVNHTWAVSDAATGNGLTASYYDNADLTGAFIKRFDPTINFNWGLGSPDPGIAPDTFSALWVGYVEPQYTETYTFYAKTDDGVKLWVNNILLINHWESGSGEWSGTIDLVANSRYRIRMEYFEDTDTASAELSWESASVLRTAIPQNLLYSSTAKMTVVTVRDSSGTSMSGRVMTFDL